MLDLVSVEDIDRVASVVQAVMKKGDTIYGKALSVDSANRTLTINPLAASDSRKNGIAAGY